MKRILVLAAFGPEETRRIRFLTHEFELRRIPCSDRSESLPQRIARLRESAEAIALEALPLRLEMGRAAVDHSLAHQLKTAAGDTPLVDGSGVRATLERWAVTLADRAEPGLFSRKRILLVPGLGHPGLVRALRLFTDDIRYADPALFFSVPDYLPGVGSLQTHTRLEALTLDLLEDASVDRLSLASDPSAASCDDRSRRLTPASIAWADILAGDVQAILHHAPGSLRNKMILVESATAAQVEELKKRAARVVIMLVPSPEAVDGSEPSWSAAALEAVLAALCPEARPPLHEDAYLELLADLSWTPRIIWLQPDQAGVNRFSFVIHPLSVADINRHPSFRWTRFFPDTLVESLAALLPPLYVSRVRGAESPETGRRIEGHLITLGATPRQMMRRDERFTYNKLNQAARMSERLGARIMGLGAFTSVVGDAGLTVANEAKIAVTSGNSLTVAATIEAAVQGVERMGLVAPDHARAMVVGATGSIGSVCARLLARLLHDVVLVSVEPERLIELKRKILSETPDARVTVATRTDQLLDQCDLVVTATSAFGERILHISDCKPGAVICDVARPPDINAAEAALRPDVLVIESGEVLIPGDIDFGFDIGLPPGTAYACLAETALLAMEGRFEDYTIGRDLSTEKVKEIHRLFKKHGFRLAGLRSFGHYITEEDLREKHARAAALRDDPVAFTRARDEARLHLAEMPARSKGIRHKRPSAGPNVLLALAAGLAGYQVGKRLFGRS